MTSIIRLLAVGGFVSALFPELNFTEEHYFDTPLDILHLLLLIPPTPHTAVHALLPSVLVPCSVFSHTSPKDGSSPCGLHFLQAVCGAQSYTDLSL